MDDANLKQSNFAIDFFVLMLKSLQRFCYKKNWFLIFVFYSKTFIQKTKNCSFPL